MLLRFILLTFMLNSFVYANELTLPPTIKQTAPPPESQPATPEVDPELESQVRIIETPNKIIHEYRSAGRVYMVKIFPSAGPPYYLVDMDGDGILETSRYNLDGFLTPQWILFSW